MHKFRVKDILLHYIIVFFIFEVNQWSSFVHQIHAFNIHIDIIIIIAILISPNGLDNIHIQTNQQSATTNTIDRISAYNMTFAEQFVVA